ncbi:MAG: replication-relaxation family protein [Thermincolia bacterium]
MNLVQKGSNRDNGIIHALEDWRVMDTEQIRHKFFQFPSGKRKAQERLLMLHRKGKVNRWKGDEGYCYSLDNRPGRAEHLVMLNWVRLWFEARLKSWEKIHTFQYEHDYGFLRSDGFVSVKNIALRPEEPGHFRFWFIEMDRTHSNVFDKVPKYCRLFELGGYEGRWWVKLTDRFPTVLVVTTTESRKNKILRHVAEENSIGLQFDVRLLCDLRKEVSS